MNLAIFQRILNGEDHRQEILAYFIENCSIITRKPYSNKNYDNNFLYCVVFSYFAKKDKELYNYIIENTKHIDTSLLRERIYCLLNNISNRTCHNGREKKFKNSSASYIFCGNHGKCACQNEDFLRKVHSKSEIDKKKIVIRRKETNKKRFGAEVPLHNSEIKKKSENTSFERYGTTSPLSSRKVRKKIEETNLERYGFECALSNPDIQKKRIDTMITVYGVENPAHVEEFQKKKTETNQFRYGSPSPFGNPIIREKAAQTNFIKFGASNIMKNKEFLVDFFERNIVRLGSRSPFGSVEIQNKVKQTNLSRLGFENPLDNPEINKKMMTMMERYGAYSPFGNIAVREKAMKTKIERYGVRYYFNEVLDNNIDILFEEKDNGKDWVSRVIKKWCENRKLHPDEKLKNPFSVTRAYYRKVMFWTHFHWKENIDLINPQNFERSYWEYHLDHIYSIRDGFINNVPPEVIGHWTNLRLMPRLDNQKKNHKSERTLEEVIFLYSQKCK